MKIFQVWSIRSNLYFVVFLAVLPALAIILYSGMERRQDALKDAELSSKFLAYELATHQERTVASARQLLTTLAQLPEVRSSNDAACTALFTNILRDNKQFKNLQLIDLNGIIFASGVPLPGKICVADRKYFSDAVRTRTFSAGEYIVGRTTGKQMLNFGYPVIDNNGKLLNVLQVGLDLTQYEVLFAKAKLPAGSAYALIDHKGTILYRSPGNEKYSGKPDRPENFRQMTGPQEEGSFISIANDGIKRVVAYRQLRLTDDAAPYLYLRVGVPEKTALAEVRRILTRNLILFGLAALLAAATAWLIGNISIAVRMDKLTDVARRLGEGDLTARTGLSDTGGDLGQLANTFDRMGSALAERDKELKRVVSELRDANRNVLAEKAKTEAIIAAIGDGVSIQDTSYRIIYQNNVHMDMVGKHQGEYCYHAYEQKEQICEVCPVNMAFTDGQVHTAEKCVSNESGDSYFWITASPLRDGTGEIIAGIEVVKDISSRKQMELELAQKARELTESNNELQQFAYIASHDLQEPLRTITSFIQLLAKRYRGNLDQNADEFIDFITDGAKRMQQLINDLLTYSRVESKGKPLVPVDCNQVVHRAMLNLTTAIEECGAVIRYESLPTVMADESQLVQLFQNLLGNAIKFRGDIAPQIEITAVAEGSNFHIKVRDNGIGISPSYHERIFEIFQRLNKREHYSGTGIGLALCKKIVDRHGGRIWVESEDGQGAIFHFTLQGK